MQQRSNFVSVIKKFQLTSEDDTQYQQSPHLIKLNKEQFETTSDDEVSVYQNLERFLPPANAIILKPQNWQVNLKSIYTQPYRSTPQFNVNYTAYKEQPISQTAQLVVSTVENEPKTFLEFYDDNKENLVYQRFEDIDLGKLPVEGTRVYFASITANIQKKHPKMIFRQEQVIARFQDHQGQKIIFESNFESGNLFCAFKRSDEEYDLILQNDFNTRGNTQWFFFSVKGFSNNQTIRFNILNHLKTGSLFNDGLKPAVYSVQENQKHGHEWIRSGQNVSYYRNQYKKEYLTSTGYSRHYYTLSFDYTFKHDNDEVYFAHSYPYTYTDLQNYLNKVLMDTTRNQNISKKVLCKSILGNDCDVITITSSSLNRIQYRKGIVFLARQHPGEPQGSYVMQGIIDYLVSPEAEFLRENCVFKIIPMINADGVILGNYRCGLDGGDLNRHWKKPNKKLHPTCYFAKKYIKGFSQERKVLMVCDLHGHSRKSLFCLSTGRVHSFTGAATPLSKNQLNEYLLCSCPRFLKMVERIKDKTARIQLWRELKVNWSYTYECSFFGQNRTHYTIQDYMNCGRDLCMTLKELMSDFVKKRDDGSQNIQQRLMQEMESLPPTDDIDSGSDSCPSENELSDDELVNLLAPAALTVRQRQNMLKKQQSSSPQKVQKQQRSMQIHQTQQLPTQQSQLVQSQLQSSKRHHIRIMVTQRQKECPSPLPNIPRPIALNISLKKDINFVISPSPTNLTQEILRMVDKCVQTDEWLYRDWIIKMGKNNKSLQQDSQIFTPQTSKPHQQSSQSLLVNFIVKNSGTTVVSGKSEKDTHHVKANFSQGFAQLKVRQDYRYHSQLNSLLSSQNNSLSRSKLPLLFSCQK